MWSPSWPCGFRRRGPCTGYPLLRERWGWWAWLSSSKAAVDEDQLSVETTQRAVGMQAETESREEVSYNQGPLSTGTNKMLPPLPPSSQSTQQRLQRNTPGRCWEPPGLLAVVGRLHLQRRPWTSGAFLACHSWWRGPGTPRPPPGFPS